FGVETLGPVSSLPEDERTAVRAHARLPLINTVLRETASEGDITTRTAEYVHNADLADALPHRFGTRAAMTARRDQLDDQAHRTAAEERERQALKEILSDDSPEERWARVDADSWTHQDLITLYDEHLHQDFSPIAVGDYLARLDRATGRELPLTEPIRV